MKKITVEFEVQGQDDRRDLVAVLADNGYKVKVEHRGKYPNKYSFVIVEADEPAL